MHDNYMHFSSDHCRENI